MNDPRSQRVSVFAPATVANVGPGFDSCGFALEGPGDVVRIARSSRPGVRIVGVTGADLPTDPRKNAAGAVVARMLKDAGTAWGADLHIEKGLPIGTGMGSSAASSAAAAVAANELLGAPYDGRALVAFAAEGERAACGAAHADNVAAAVMGGFTVVPPDGPAGTLRLPVPAGWTVAVVRPHVVVSTKRARASLPVRVAFAAGVRQAGSAAALVASLAARDIRAFGAAMSSDRLVEPRRAAAIPAFDEVRAAAFAAGAYGVAVSGSGPSVVALTDGRRRAKVVAGRMRDAWAAHGVDADIHVSRAGAPGARVIS